jgi:putative Holliday junction resolvase
VRDPGRVLALDLGDSRVGVAVSDPLRITAQPLIPIRAADLNQVRELVREHEVGCVVVGDPLLLSGVAGERSRRAREFADRLRRRLPGVAVELWDERLSTVQAERVLTAGHVRRDRRKGVIDSLAAVLILQSYLDARARGVDRR